MPHYVQHGNDLCPTMYDMEATSKLKVLCGGGETDPGIVKIQTQKKFRITLFIRTQHNVRIFVVIPFIKRQNDTQTKVQR